MTKQEEEEKEIEVWKKVYDDFKKETIINPSKLEEYMMQLPQEVFELRIKEAYNKYEVGKLQVKINRLVSDLYFRAKLAPNLYNLPKRPSKDTIYSVIDQDDDILALKEDLLELELEGGIIIAKANALEKKSKMVQRLQENIDMGQIVIERETPILKDTEA